MKLKPKPFPALLLSLVILALITSSPGPTVRAVGGGTTVQVWASDYASSDILDPTMVVGSVFVLDVYALDIPPINPLNPSDGGINSYDITLIYNSTVLVATDVNHRAPLCPVSEGCLFDSSSAFQLRRDINDPPGSVRSAVALLGERVDSSSGTTLFRVRFSVAGIGFTTISIFEPNNSSLISLGATVIPYKPVDGRFENRPPFRLDVDPSFATVFPGQSAAVNVTASLVWTISSFGETIGFGLTGLPPNALATFSPTNGTLDFVTRLTISTVPTTPAQLYTVTVTGISASSNVRVSQNFTLSVVLVDMAVLSVTPSPATVAVGNSVSISVGVRNNGSQAATYDLNIKANATTISQNTGLLLASLTTTTLTVVWNTTGFPLGLYSLSAEILALPNEDELSNNVLAQGTVIIGADFTVSLGSASGTLIQGQTLQVTVDVNLVSPVTELVSLSLTGLGTGVTPTFTPSSGSPTFTATLTLDATATAATGSFNIQVTGTSATFTRSASFALTLVSAHDVAVVSVTSSSAVINPGGSTSITIMVENNGSFSESFTVNLFALPQSGGPVSAGNSQVTGLAPAGTNTVTLTWTPQNIANGVYNFRAEIPAVSGEQNTADNALTQSSARLNAAPAAEFTASPASPEAGSAASFDASQSSDQDGTVASYSWNFGDGTGAVTGITATHTYQSAGNYTITLTVTDNDGASKTLTRTVAVTQAGGLVPFLASPFGLGLILLAIIVAVALVLFYRRRMGATAQKAKKSG